MRRDYRLEQLSGLEFSRQGCCTLRTWETLGLAASTMQTFLWPTVFDYVSLLRPVQRRTDVFVTGLWF
jgi:hypothetical protein